MAPLLSAALAMKTSRSQAQGTLDGICRAFWARGKGRVRCRFRFDWEQRARCRDPAAREAHKRGSRARGEPAVAWDGQRRPHYRGPEAHPWRLANERL
jgi:hypothetical protein